MVLKVGSGNDQLVKVSQPLLKIHFIILYMSTQLGKKIIFLSLQIISIFIHELGWKKI